MAKRSVRRSRRISRRSKKNMKSRRSCKCSKGGMRKTRSKRGRRSMKNTRSKRGRRSMKRMRGGMKGASLNPADAQYETQVDQVPKQPPEQASVAPQEGSDLGGVQEGGGLIPRPLVDFTRGIEYSMKNMFNTYRGEATPVNDNPNVLRQKLSSDPQYKLTPTDINALHNNAADLVTTYQPYPVPYNE